MTPIGTFVCRLLVLCSFVAGAQAASYPDRTIEMVVAGSAGGGLDLLGRALDSTSHRQECRPMR